METVRYVLFTLVGLLILLVLIFFSNPLGFSNYFSPYKTQTIIYRNKEDKSIMIEFQMQDVGALGYNRRTVKVEQGIFFDFVSEINVNYIDKSKLV